MIGFDDVEQASIMHPPLTTISQPIYEMGKAAVEILIGQINRKDRVPEHRKFDVRLIERESCRALQASAAAMCPPADQTVRHTE